MKKIDGLPAAISAIAFRGDSGQLAVAGEDNTIRVINPADAKTIKELKGHQGKIGALAYSLKDGNLLFSAAADKIAKLWDVNQGKSIRDFSGHADAVVGLNVSRDGTKIITGSNDKTARIWNVADGKVVATLTGHAGPVSAVFLSDDNNRVATGSADQSVRFWEAASGRELERMTRHKATISGVAMLSDNKSIVSAGGDKLVRVWTPAAVRIFAGHQGPVLSVAVHPGGGQLFTASADKSIKVFDVNNGNVLRTLAGHSGAVKAVALTKDGNKVVSGSDDKSFRVWNAADGKPLLTIPNLAASVDSVAAAGNNTMAAAGLANGAVKIFNIGITDSEKAELASYQMANAAVGAVAFTADSAGLLAGAGDKNVALWAVPPAAPKTLSGHTGEIFSVAFSPDGKLAATAASDKSARLWDVAKGTQVRSLVVPEKVAYSVAFNPKGDLLATGGDDKLIRYWNVADGKELRKSAGHGASVYAVAFSPDGTKLASGSIDKTVGSGTLPTARSCTSSTVIPTTSTRLPSAPTAGSWPRWAMAGISTSGTWPAAKPLFHQHLAPYTMTYGVAWSPDNTQLAVAASDNNVYLLKLPDLSGGRMWNRGLWCGHRREVTPLRVRAAQRPGRLRPMRCRIPTRPSKRQQPSSYTNW